MEIETNTKVIGRFRPRTENIDAAKFEDSDSCRQAIQTFFAEEVEVRQDVVIAKNPSGGTIRFYFEDWIVRKPDGFYIKMREEEIRKRFVGTY